MAWAEKQKSGRWAPRYRDLNHVTRGTGKTYTRKAEAERVAAVEEDKARRRPGTYEPGSGKLAWGEWVLRWWPTRDVEPSTELEDRKRRDKHLMPRWGDVALERIRREDVQEWVDTLGSPRGAKLGPSSTRHCFHLLSASLRAAVDAGRMESSPCHGVRLPRVPEPDERFLTHAEVNAVSRVLSGKYRTMVLLLVGTGLRWGEAAGLHWHRVDLDEGWIDVRESHDGKLRTIKPYAKGGTAAKQRLRRRVWPPDWLVDELRAHRVAHPPAPRCETPHRDGHRCRSGLVIPGRDQVAMDYSAFRTGHWNRAVGGWEWVIPGDPAERSWRHPSAAAKALRAYPDTELARRPISGRAGIAPATIHDLRHTFASWALQAEPPMPIYDLAIAMGHTDTTVTRLYGHLEKSSRDRFRRALAWPSDDDTAKRSPSGPFDDEVAMIDRDQRRA